MTQWLENVLAFVGTGALMGGLVYWAAILTAGA